jgi:uncharacterized protein (DUF4415 family)
MYMTDKLRKSARTWSDPDDAPDWTDEQIARAEIAHGDKIVRPATGTLTRPRGRPKTENPKINISLRVEPAVLERYRSLGPGWQARAHDALKAGAEMLTQPRHDRADRIAAKPAARSASSGSSKTATATAQRGSATGEKTTRAADRPKVTAKPRPKRA